MDNKFYITTPIYYTNAKPHIGHAYTTIACDVLARWNRLQGKEVFFLTGTDEHGAKIEKKAKEEGKDPQEFVDGFAEIFQDLWKQLNISNDNFIRTTSAKHKVAVQKVLQTLFDNGSIYKGSYKGLYCVGCEQFKSENELVDGKCPDHGTVPEEMEEECYLMKMNKWQNTLVEKIKNDEFKIQPERYKKEILSFLESQKLEDVSISRKNLKWGIPLPFDKEHTTYVWIDAFLNYLTGLGWDGDVKNMPRHVAGEDSFTWWPADVEMIGKDILRVHATIWAATLLNLGIELPKSFVVHGHIQSGGKKMSKSLGNVIAPEEMLEKFGTDGTRYLLMSGGTFGDDLDLTMERMTEKYNADLANGLGNLTSRIVTLYGKTDLELPTNKLYEESAAEFRCGLGLELEAFNYGTVLDVILTNSRMLDKLLETEKPWEIIKNNKDTFDKKIENYIKLLISNVAGLETFIPDTFSRIKIALETKKAEPLFQRIK